MITRKVSYTWRFVEVLSDLINFSWYPFSGKRLDLNYTRGPTRPGWPISQPQKKIVAWRSVGGGANVRKKGKRRVHLLQTNIAHQKMTVCLITFSRQIEETWECLETGGVLHRYIFSIKTITKGKKTEKLNPKIKIYISMKAQSWWW